MKKKIIFTILFLFSLPRIQVASLTDWLILSFFIHLIWLTITSNQVLKNKKTKSKSDNIFIILNKSIVYVFVIDVIIIVLSASFGFRLIFAYFYKPTFYLSLVCVVVSFLGNYFVLIRCFNQQTDSLIRKILLIVSSLFYPIGVYTVTEKLIYESKTKHI